MMGETFVIGGLSLNKVWLVYAIGFALAYVIFQKRHQETVSILFNVLIIIILLWRFGAFLFDPVTFLKNPALLIQSVGTQREIMTGVIASIFYLMVRNHRSPINLVKLLDVAALSLLAVLFVKNMLVAEYGMDTSMPWGVSIEDPAYTYHPLNIYHAVWIGLLLFILWRLKLSFGEGKYFIYVLFFGGLGYMLISLCDARQNAILLLSNDQWIYLICMIVGLVLTFKQSKMEKE